MCAHIAVPSYGTGWVGAALPDWRAETKINGSGGMRFPWNYGGENIAASINKYRKGTCRITVVDTSNAPRAGINCVFAQTQHAFPFSQVYNVGMLSDHPDIAHFGLLTLNLGRQGETITAADRKAYQARFLDGTWTGTKGESATTPSMYNGIWDTGFNRADEAGTNSFQVNKWLKNKLKWRMFGGHVMIYPGAPKMPPYDGDFATRRAFWRANFISQVIQDNIDNIDEWDLTNEVGQDHTMYPVSGGVNAWECPELVADLQYCQTLSKRKMYVNDWQSPVSARSWLQYYRSIGLNVEGLGYQGHLGPNPSTNPDDYCSSFGASSYMEDNSTTAPWDWRITELDCYCGNQQQADATMALFRAAFAYPNCTSICSFGMWDPIHWIEEFFGGPGSGFYDVNWNAKPLMTAYNALVKSEWWTTGSGATNGSGYYEFSGFYGAYTASVIVNGQQRTLNFELAPNMKEVVFVL